MTISNENLKKMAECVQNLRKLHETLAQIEEMLTKDEFYTGLDRSSQLKFYGDYDNSLTQYIFVVYSTRRLFTLTEIIDKPKDELEALCKAIISNPGQYDVQRVELDEIGAVKGELQDEILYNECYVRLYRNVFAQEMKINHNHMTMCQSSRYLIHKLFNDRLASYIAMNQEVI